MRMGNPEVGRDRKAMRWQVGWQIYGSCLCEELEKDAIYVEGSLIDLQSNLICGLGYVDLEHAGEIVQVQRYIIISM